MGKHQETKDEKVVKIGQVGFSDI